MAKSFKDWFNLLHESGDSTVTFSESVPVGGKTQWILGRSSECDLVYSGAKISRKHCMIELINSHYYLSDLDSTNGTYLNGKLIEHTERVFAGDIISVGSVDIVFTPDMLT